MREAPPQEMPAPQSESLRLEAKRKEQFPAIDQAMRSYESAVTEQGEFFEDLKRRAAKLPFATSELGRNVRDWTENLIPGTTSVKIWMDSFLRSLRGKFAAGAPPLYHPSTLKDITRAVMAYIDAKAAAKDLGSSQAFTLAEDAVTQAEKALKTAISALEEENPETMIHAMDLQQRIFAAREAEKSDTKA